MSVLEPVDGDRRETMVNWVQNIEQSGDTGQLVLYNFFLEDRLCQEVCTSFTLQTLDNCSSGSGPFESYHEAIANGNLLLLIPAVSGRGQQSCLHFTSRWYLEEKRFITELPLDEPPPKQVVIKKPLGTGKEFLWVTPEASIDFATQDAVTLRNLLGLPSTRSDYLYCFKYDMTTRPSYVPTVFDAFGHPPYRPVGGGNHWGVTRNLLDDSEGAPERLTAPLSNLSECPIGILVEPELDSVPPRGYVTKRLNEMESNRCYQEWRRKWTR